MWSFKLGSNCEALNWDPNGELQTEIQMGSFKLCSKWEPNTKKKLITFAFLGSLFYQNILARSMCFCELKNKVVSGFARKTYLLPEFLHGCSTKKLKKILYKLKSADCKIHIRKLKLTLFVRVQIISYFGHPGEINTFSSKKLIQ